MKIVLLFLFTITCNCIFSQVTESFYADAQTQVDDPDGDGFTSDACSFGDISMGFSLGLFSTLETMDCSSVGEGRPFVQGSYLFEIDHSSYPVQNFLSYNMPYAFHITLVGHYSGSTSPFINVQSQQTNGSLFQVDFLESNSQETLFIDNGKTMTLPDNTMSISFDINASLDDDYEILMLHGTEGTSADLSIMVPSQFYLDNGLPSPPSFVAINSTDGPSFQNYYLPVVQKCAENVILEDVDLQSYIYSASNDLIVKSNIPAGENVTFRAGNSVTLARGFNAECGSTYSIGNYSGCTN